ncbi:MAG TPA: hypothetical protein VGK74_22180 [Symbiobacteriaceae bacterium]|jgi:hypothetical protein
MSIQNAATAAVARWDGRTVGGMDLPTVMVAIAGAESGWRDDAAGDLQVDSQYKCGGYASYGLWQFNMAAHYDYLARATRLDSPCAWSAWLMIPANCARAASVLIGEAQEYPLSALRPWTVWWSQDGGDHDAGDGNGVWRSYWEQARAAVTATRQSSAAPLPQPGSFLGFSFSRVGLTVGIALLGVLGLAALIAGVRELEGESDPQS